MMKRTLIASVSAITLAGAASAQVAANATTDLNLRTGPGPSFEIPGVIPADGAVEIERCIAEGAWCEVSYDGQTGWAYSQYLTATVDSEPTVVYENYAPLEVTTVERNSLGGGLAGAAVGAAAGALIAGPVGAAAGTAAAAGGLLGGAIGADAGIEETTVTYIQDNPVEPVYLDGEVVVGAGVPQGVAVYEVPEAPVQYAYINGRPVAIDPETRQIVYIVR
ncbi:SH3 domain-containing protein [Palleronia salina]|uniref:SH3 domain-containing protein n=2 Tax=Palleronia salina TaxID=313368 RepID=A0A1M6FM06_9RHOB|nr:SH3 domain-containing protein [Palleronia salina]